MIIRSLKITAAVAVCISLSAFAAAQDPAANPSPSPASVYAGYEVTSNVEIGVRGVDINGNHDKYRSDLNYRPGLRLFDSSFRLENRAGGSRAFDSALITTTGFGSDPSGSFRFNLDKTGIYKFDSNVRRVKYYNFLNNHAAPEPFIGGIPRGQHNFDTDHKFGDFDL